MIRDYQVSDWTEVCRVYDASKPYELATGGIEASFIPLATDTKRIELFSNSKVYVWEEEGVLRGFVGNKGTYISWLLIDPVAFRRGLARALLRHIVPRITGEPWLWVLKDNKPAITLYSSEGFEIEKEWPANNGGLPCIALEMRLRVKV